MIGPDRPVDRAGHGTRCRPARPWSAPFFGILVLVALLLGGQGAGAQQRDVSRGDAAALAREAETDDDALARLRAVTSIDDRPVDLVPVVGDLGEERVARLEALASELGGAPMPGAAGGGEPSPADARGQARAVLDADKFQQSDVPKPFKGALEWLADRLRPIGRFVERIVDPILDLPGGAWILGTALVAVAAAATAWLVGRRSGAAVRATAAGGGPLVDASADPIGLDRRAGEREGAGDLAGALRLRYQAGLVRLVRADRLTLRTDTTAADAARQVDHPAMDALTMDFEEIVYGDRAATAADLHAAGERWDDLLRARSRS